MTPWFLADLADIKADDLRVSGLGIYDSHDREIASARTETLRDDIAHLLAAALAERDDAADWLRVNAEVSAQHNMRTQQSKGAANGDEP